MKLNRFYQRFLSRFKLRETTLPKKERIIYVNYIPTSTDLLNPPTSTYTTTTNNTATTNENTNRTSITTTTATTSSSSSSSSTKWVYTKYPTNKIVTSKYTLLTFLPKTLYEQFRRLANLFFLLLIILQCFREFMTVDPLIAALPTILIVLATSLKDGFEDLKRHATDNQVNHRRAYVLPYWINKNYPETMQVVNEVNERIHSPFSFQFNTNDRLLRSKKIEQKRTQGVRTLTMAMWHGLKRVFFFSTFQSHALQLSSTNTNAIDEAEKDKKNKEKAEEEEEEEVHTPIDELTEGDEILDVEEVMLRQSDPWKPIHWQDVRVGDFILLRKNDILPADICILSTSEPSGVCYTETKNLDGETNLKLRKGLKETSFLTTPEDCRCTPMLFTVEPPTNNMFSFQGTVQVFELNDQGQPQLTPPPSLIPIDMTNMLLRGCVLRNTSWVIGLVIYNGIETKLKLNSGKTPLKRSMIEKKMNFHILINLALIFLMCIICALGNSTWSWQFNLKKAPFVPIGEQTEKDIPKNAFYAFWNSLVAFQNIVPISLYLTVEVVKSLQAYFIHLDSDMYYEEADAPCTPKSWNLADDLGQIEYLFSDKTGTLTRNVMEFRRCSIHGKKYGSPLLNSTMSTTKKPFNSNWFTPPLDFIPSSPYASKHPKFYDAHLFQDLNNEVLQDPNQVTWIRDFWRLIGICHTVLISKPDPKQPHHVQYKAQSPDEAALVDAARDIGVTFVGRQETEIFLDMQGMEEKYDLLAILEFNSSRKRMSIIARTPNQDIVLYCKGADNVIFQRLSPSVDDQLKKTTLAHLEQFAEEGLRTLCLGYRKLDPTEFQVWLEQYQQACVVLTERESKIDAVAELIEKDLLLLGATAIEDQLQDGVPECIHTLRKANIKIWVLTGDKMETAISIGFSCNLLSKELHLISIKEPDHPNEKSVHDQLLEVHATFFDALEASLSSKVSKPRSSFSASTSKSSFSFSKLLSLFKKKHSFIKPSTLNQSQCALIIDGIALKSILENKESKSILLKIGVLCKVVICCRTSPLQKAQVVSLVKEGKKAVTCAIGDGANDVSMIQEAHIGVGILGEEGLQAAMASDYAIGQFRYLSRLLLVHGRWSYHRISELILNFFYKDIIFVFVIFWYQFYAGYSTRAPFDFTYMLYYNLFFTNWSVAALGVFDQDVPAYLALKAPKLYQTGIQQMFYTHQRFWYYMVDGIYQSLICYFIPYGVYSLGQATQLNGVSDDNLEMGTTMAASAITTANLFIALNTFSFTWLNHVGIWVLSLGVFYGYLVVYFFIPDTPLFGYNALLWSSISFWFSIVMAVFASLLPKYLLKYYQRMYHPMDRDIALEYHNLGSTITETFNILDIEEQEQTQKEEEQEKEDFTKESLKNKANLEEGKEDPGTQVSPYPLITITSPSPLKTVSPKLLIPNQFVNQEKQLSSLEDGLIDSPKSPKSLTPTIVAPPAPQAVATRMKKTHHRGFSFSTDESGGMREVLIHDIGSNLHFHVPKIPEEPLQRRKSNASDFDLYRPRPPTSSTKTHARTHSESVPNQIKKIAPSPINRTPLTIKTTQMKAGRNIRQISELGSTEGPAPITTPTVPTSPHFLHSPLSPLSNRAPRPPYHHHRTSSRVSGFPHNGVPTSPIPESQLQGSNFPTNKSKS